MMIIKHELPNIFVPSFERDYEIFGSIVNVQVQYIGPLPEVGREKNAENFLYAMYMHGERIESGSLKWDPSSGPLTMQEAGKAIIVHWATSFSE